MAPSSSCCTSEAAVVDEVDELSHRIHQEAPETLAEEPELATLLHRTVLAPGVQTFEDAVSATVGYRLLQQPCAASSASEPMFCPHSLKSILDQAFCQQEQGAHPELLEYGHTMSYAVRKDALAVLQRDPACNTLLEVVLFTKGFAALVCHRAARHKWMLHQQRQKTKKRRNNMTALFLQSQASAVFGLDIHPATTIGAGVMLDHGTGVVLGETAVVGDGCTLLHGVTLGGTGKETGDRHPKVGNDVLIGAGASLLGNIRIGHGCKIGAGSIVLRPIPDGATAVGAPAKIVGRAVESKPGSTMDETIRNVALLHTTENAALASASNKNLMAMMYKSESNNTVATMATTLSVSSDVEEDEEDEESTTFCPYRDYTKVHAPANTVTYCLLKKWLAPKGCTADEIGSVFFALDTRSVGYVYWKEFQERASTVMEQHITSLSPSRIQEILKGMPTPPKCNGNGNTAVQSTTALKVS